MSARLDTGPVMVNATRFRAAHEADWARLEAIVTRIEKRSVRVLDDDDLLALPVLYRSALSSLSVARETSLDRALVRYLEQLCTRAYFQIYGVPGTAAKQIRDFFLRGWPLAVQALWKETLASLAVTLAGAIVGYLLVIHDPTWFYAIIPQGLAEGRDPAASAEALKQAIYFKGGADDWLTTFATYLFTHNSQIAIFCFALGFAFAIPTALLLVYNGLMLGAFFAVHVPKGLGVAFGGWISIHGTTELFAITLAGAAGFRIGTAIAFPGRQSRMDSAVAAGRAAGPVVAGVVVMLMIAGLLEGIGRQTVLIDWERYAIGWSVFAGWITYFYLPRGRRGADA